MSDSNVLPCGHSRDNLTEIENKLVCYVCWAVDSGNYTYDLRTAPQVAHDEVTHLAEKVRLLAATVAEQGRILQQLLNREDYERRDRTVAVVAGDRRDAVGGDSCER